MSIGDSTSVRVVRKNLPKQQTSELRHLNVRTRHLYKEKSSSGNELNGSEEPKRNQRGCSTVAQEWSWNEMRPEKKTRARSSMAL